MKPTTTTSFVRENICGCANVVGLPCVEVRSNRVVWICVKHWKKIPGLRAVTDCFGAAI